MNTKTKKKINNLLGHELTALFKELHLKGYSKLLVGQKKKRLLQEIDEGRLLKAMFSLEFVDQSEVKWKRWFFKKQLVWKEKPKNTKVQYNTNSVSNNYPPLYYLLLFLILSSSIFYFKSSIAHLLFSNYVCAEINERDKTRVAELAIELNNQIHKGKQYKSELQKLLTDKVFWFKPPKQSKYKIPIGTKLYDKFCFCEKPSDIFVGQDTYEDGSFKFSVLGAYRYSHPKDTLYKVQRLHVEIKEGLISSIKSYDEDNDVIESANRMYRKFWLLPVILAVLFFLFFSLSDDMKKFVIKNFISRS